MTRTGTLLLTIILTSAVLSAPVSAQPPRPAPSAEERARPRPASITITDVMIPVNDSIRLHGRLYQPAADSSRPTIIAMTPYTVDVTHEFGRYFAERGYGYLAVDVRGRGNSEGTFRPMRQDGPDGAAVAGWIARQPWNDGQVAMRGQSYPGMVQWQVLGEAPGLLDTAVPTAAVYPGWDLWNPFGIFVSYTARWLGSVQGRADHYALFDDGAHWKSRYRALHRSGRPFSELAEMAGLLPRSQAIFERWTEHPHLDDFWRAPSPDSSDYSQLDQPILTVTGHFDWDQRGALRYYREHMQYGTETGTQKHHLLIGPWNHAGTRDPKKTLGGLTFADTAAIDMNRLHLKWFDWVLKDGPKPKMLQDRVVYYVMSAGQWRTAPSLQAVSDTSRTFYLQSPGKNPDDPFDAGTLTRQVPKSRDTDRYVYNPRDTADIATLETMQKDGTAVTERYTVSGAAFLEGPKLIYHSRPVEEPFELSGQMRLDAWIELNVPDTDLAAWVYEIRPTGKTIHLGWTKLRARHRNGVETAELAQPGTVQQYTLDRFYWTSQRVQKGSRIRLVIAPLNDPAWQKNYNAAKPVMEQSVEDARTATVKLHIGPEHPSKLVLPVRADGRS